MRLSSRALTFALSVSIFISTAGCKASHAKIPDKLYGQNAFGLPNACGDGLDQNSACGNCARVGGIAVTKAASCGHVCVELPDNLGPDKVTLVPYGGEGDNVKTASYKQCGAPYAPCLGWDRYEGTEWYADTHMICGRFKNWSHDRSRSYSVRVYEK